jgi:hypothetical protein
MELPDTTEIRLIAELKDCHQDSLAKKNALSHPRQSVMIDDYAELVKAAENGKLKEQAVRGKLRAHRRAKLRKKDFHDLRGLRVALNDLEGELDSIFSDNDLYREQFEHSSEATIDYQQHWRRLRTIREQLGRLKLVMNAVDGSPDMS